MNYTNIFSLVETSLEEFTSLDQGLQFCQQESKVGSVFRYQDQETQGAYKYHSCIGQELLASKSKESNPSFFKAFKSDPNFFRQFSGYIHISHDDSQNITVRCFRLPEQRSSIKTFPLSSALQDLCGSVFAFKFSIEDSDKIKDASISFAGGGSPTLFELGQFK